VAEWLRSPILHAEFETWPGLRRSRLLGKPEAFVDRCDQFWRHDRSMRQIDTPRRDVLGEGPIWDAAGAVLWWVDIAGRGLRRYQPSTGDIGVWDLPEPAGSVAPTASGGLLLAVPSGFARFDPATNEFQHIIDPEPDRSGNRFNEGKCDRQGRFWAGSMDAAEKARTGALYRLDLDGTPHRIFDGLGIPNTLAWSADSKTMYFAETLDRTIYAFDFDPTTGTPSNRRVFVKISGPGYPDGSTIDEDGHLWNAEWDGWRIVRYTPDGTVDRVVEMPVQRPTSCMFGGPDLSTLFVTSASRGLTPDQLAQQPGAGGLFALATDTRGIPETRFGGRF